MAGYLLRRVLAYAVMTFVATSLAYLAAVSFLRPEVLLLQATPRPSIEQVQSRLTGYGLDPTASAFERYVAWLGDVLLRWDWGLSPNGVPVGAEFLERAAVSGRLMVLATVAQIVLGVALGVYTATRQHRGGVNQDIERRPAATDRLGKARDPIAFGQIDRRNRGTAAG